ncbi:MAG: selenocysteine-specific translation elongation factor [Terriglobales bacterium]
MIVGTAGHIDHGKSALVEALTGVHPDRLPEERRRGITLDLGFGHWIENGVPVGVVDVPGHERLVRTMLAGASGVDVLLLVVAADAGVQPQTLEHFDICRLLGLHRGVVALSKRDLVGAPQAARVRAQIAALLAGSPLAAAPVIEVSAATGEGIETLRRALVEVGRQAPVRDSAAPFRLPIDRAFTLQGRGTIITGTLAQGTLGAGGEAELAPLGQRVRLRGLQVHGTAVAQALAGQRVAVNLAGVDVAALHRGLELVVPGVFARTRAFDARLDWLAPAPAPHRARLRLHIHTAETIATVLWLDGPAWAQLLLTEPVVAAPGDRLILRQLSPAATVAGGCVLDPCPPRHRRADAAAAAAHLRLLAGAANLEQSLLIHLQQAGGAGAGVAALALATGHRLAQVRAALEVLATQGDCVLSSHPPAAVAASAFAPLEAEVLAALAAFHQREPLAQGAALDALGLKRALPWLAGAAARLQAAGKLKALAGGRFRLSSAAAARSPQQLQLSQRLEEHFRALGWSAPPWAQMLPAFPQPDARALVADLERAGVLVQCQPGWFLHASALDRLRALLAGHKAGHASFSVGDFKQWTGLTRKLAIPLLEYCDRARLTRRAGEARFIL